VVPPVQRSHGPFEGDTSCRQEFEQTSLASVRSSHESVDSGGVLVPAHQIILIVDSGYGRVARARVVDDLTVSVVWVRYYEAMES